MRPPLGVPKMLESSGSSCRQRHRKHGGAEVWSLKRVYRVLSRREASPWLLEGVHAGEAAGPPVTGMGASVRALPVSRVESKSSAGEAESIAWFTGRLRRTEVHSWAPGRGTGWLHPITRHSGLSSQCHHQSQMRSEAPPRRPRGAPRPQTHTAAIPSAPVSPRRLHP